MFWLPRRNTRYYPEYSTRNNDNVVYYLPEPKKLSCYTCCKETNAYEGFFGQGNNNDYNNVYRPRWAITNTYIL